MVGGGEAGALSPALLSVQGAGGDGALPRLLFTHSWASQAPLLQSFSLGAGGVSMAQTLGQACCPRWGQLRERRMRPAAEVEEELLFLCLLWLCPFLGHISVTSSPKLESLRHCDDRIHQAASASALWLCYKNWAHKPTQRGVAVVSVEATWGKCHFVRYFGKKLVHFHFKGDLINKV